MKVLGQRKRGVVLRGREQFERSKTILRLTAHAVRLLPLSGRLATLRIVRNFPGLLGIGLRYSVLASIASGIGDNVRISEGVYLLGAEQLILGSNVSIHPMCYIDSSGGINIGDDVSIAHSTTVMSTSHQFSQGKVTRDLPVSVTPTTIGSNVWIGSGARIVAGVTVGNGSIIGAGAVVTKDIDPMTVSGGVPARPISRVGHVEN